MECGARAAGGCVQVAAGPLGRASRWLRGKQTTCSDRACDSNIQAPEPSLLPTPSTSGSSRSNIPPIPLLPLPHLGASSVSSGNLFAPSSSSSKLEAAPGLTSMPKKPLLDDPFVLDDPAEGSKGKIVRTGSVEQRKQAMMDRIKARKAGGASATLGSSVGSANLDKIRPQMSVAEQQEALKKRSTLSRLEGIAEAVWMCVRLRHPCATLTIRMFSGPSPGASTLPTPPRGRRKAIPLAEVADVVVKSSKTPISTGEYCGAARFYRADHQPRRRHRFVC